MNHFPLIQVSGSSYEMGYQHGVQAAPLIRKYLLWIEKMTGRDREELGRRALSFQPLAESVRRLERLRILVDARWGELDIDAMKTILADHCGDPAGICRHGEGGSHSICGYIAEPARGLFHVRRGHGCLGTWQAYEV